MQAAGRFPLDPNPAGGPKFRAMAKLRSKVSVELFRNQSKQLAGIIIARGFCTAKDFDLNLFGTARVAKDCVVVFDLRDLSGQAGYQSHPPGFSGH